MSRSRALVAVINSNADLLVLFAEVVEAIGLAVTTFRQLPPIEDSSAVEAFVANQHPDVIVFDVAPPFDATWQACAQVHSRFAAIPLVVTTTNATQVKAFAKDLPILEKPFHVEELATVLQQAIAGQPPGSDGAWAAG